MELIIKVEVPDKVAKTLACDICDDIIYTEIDETTAEKHEFLYACIWEEEDQAYLEKYICENCFQKYYEPNMNPDFIISFEDAPEVYQKAILNDFTDEWYELYKLEAPCNIEDLNSEVNTFEPSNKQNKKFYVA